MSAFVEVTLQDTLPDPDTVIVSPLVAKLTHEATDVLSEVLVHDGLEPVHAASMTPANENIMNRTNANIGINISFCVDSRVSLSNSGILFREFPRRSARMPRSEERGGMAARSEAEINSLLVYKSPARQGGVLYTNLSKK